MHTFLGGVVNWPEKIPLVDVHSLLDRNDPNKKRCLEMMTLKAWLRMTDNKWHILADAKVLPDDLKTVLFASRNRKEITRELIGLALHLNINCENHFSRQAMGLTLKYYNPQK